MVQFNVRVTVIDQATQAATPHIRVRRISLSLLLYNILSSPTNKQYFF